MRTIKINLLILLVAFFSACTDDDDTSVDTPLTANEEELITTVKLNFLDSNNLSSSFEFNDPDGDGGNAPTVDTIILTKGNAYSLTTEFFDRSNPNDIENITLEIKAEDDEHLVCYDLINSSGLRIDITDNDGTYELGLSALVQVSDSANSSNGRLRLILKHQPGVKDGTCSPGETDVEVEFPIEFN